MGCLPPCGWWWLLAELSKDFGLEGIMLFYVTTYQNYVTPANMANHML
jgi:hypothetical protein